MSSVAEPRNAGLSLDPTPGVQVPPRADPNLPKWLAAVGFRTWTGVAVAAILALGFIALFRAVIARQLGVDIPALAWIPVYGDLFARDGLSARMFEDWGHAFIVPIISLYAVWRSRRELRQRPAQICWPGVLPLTLGVAAYFYFTLSYSHMAQGAALILALTGLVLLLQGPARFAIFVFPLAYLAFAVSISDTIMSAITFRLQLMASQGAFIVLNSIGVETLVSGNLLQVWDQGGKVWHPLNVAEACSGLRTLVAFVALAVAIAFLSERTWWQRTALMLAAVPVALLMNIIRVAVLGIASLIDADLAVGASHKIIGMLLLVPAFGLFMLIDWCLVKIVQPTTEQRDANKNSKNKPKPKPKPGKKATTA
ncbi:MAG: exosortase/archaeosortase family protein [Phycisphaerales bacterium]